MPISGFESNSSGIFSNKHRLLLGLQVLGDEFGLKIEFVKKS
jgi:hypothetical protein